MGHDHRVFGVKGVQQAFGLWNESGTSQERACICAPPNARFSLNGFQRCFAAAYAIAISQIEISKSEELVCTIRGIPLSANPQQRPG